MKHRKHQTGQDITMVHNKLTYMVNYMVYKEASSCSMNNERI